MNTNFSDIKDILYCKSYYLDEIEIFGDHLMSVGIPYNAPTELKKNILAALKASVFGFKSIDYIKKKYGQLWDFEKIDRNLKGIHKILNPIKREVESIIELLTSGPIRPDHMGLMVSECALLRLKASYRSCYILIAQNYPYEATTICRLILEQIAWAFAIHKFEDRDDIVHQKPTKSISKLKEIIPYTGKLYGSLNKQTHIDPIHDRDYLSYQNGRVAVSFKIPHKMLLVLYYLLLITDIFRIITEHISQDYISELKAWKKIRSNFELRKRRPLYSELIRVEKILFSKNKKIK